MSAEDRLIWFQEKLVPASQAMVPILSPTAQFGLNVFEGIRGYWDGKDIQIFRFADHIERLMDSCKLIGLDSPYSTSQIADFCRDVIAANKYKCDVALRITIFVGGEGSWSSNEPVGMFIAPITRERKTLNNENHQKACISTWSRISDNSLPPRVKLGANYMNSRYAYLEAQRNGYDVPILLDKNGSVAEGPGACLFLCKKGKLITPSISSSILESITRDTIKTLAQSLNIPVEERTVDKTELYLSDELFLVGSAAEVTPLTSLDKLPICDGKVGKITKKLHEAYIEIAQGSDNSHKEWRIPTYEEV